MFYRNPRPSVELSAPAPPACKKPWRKSIQAIRSTMKALQRIGGFMRNRTSAGVISDTALSILAIVAVLTVGWFATQSAAEKPVRLAAPAYDAPASAAQETAVFAGGCFWGVQAVFQHTRGVVNAVSGYAGGPADQAKYELVVSGNTGHAEAVQVTFDPQLISYGKLLQIYFSVAHDPTQLDRQGPDHGPQYRSALFHSSALQKEVAERYIAQLEAERAFPARIVTKLAPLEAFYPAEPYHQDYATRNPHSPYIVAFDKPKIANLKSLMPEVYREEPALVAAPK
jgi:peptide-methionine (S)-S-oxide reductase